MSKTERFEIRVSKAEREAWDADAKSAGVSTAELIRKRMNADRSEKRAEAQALLGVWTAGLEHMATTANNVSTTLTIVPDATTTGRLEVCIHRRRPEQFCPVCDK